MPSPPDAAARAAEAQADEAALRTAADAGIHRIAVPTPFGIGDVNVYLIQDDPLTLVDSGPNSATALLALEDALRGLGHALTDIELLVVTHQHADHVGLARAIQARSGAEIACLDDLAPVLEDWDAWGAQDDDDALLLMQRHGVEDHVSEALRAVADIVRGWGTSCVVDRRLADGSALQLRDRELQVQHRPGHSPSDTLLVDGARRMALVGDHLLKQISSNALVSRPLRDWDGRRPQTLMTYQRSLRQTRDLDLDLVLGGHRGPITDHRTLIDERLASNDRRAEFLYDKLAGGPLTAHELAIATWGSVAVTQAFLTLSEVLGHLDLLTNAGMVVEDRSEHVIRFARA
jgi:glyoxylase-like metal-dependent hydrolase (beta-lactamase superfamily II)